MIKRVKQFQPQALISSETFRNFVEKSESEILRGISTLTILKIIDKFKQEGIYGYQLLKEIENSSKNMLVIEEGTLYPLLKKLEKEKLISSQLQAVQGRNRKYYFITEEGAKIQNHLNGFFSKLIESISGLFDLDVHLQDDIFYYCPNCANKIDLRNEDVRFCEVCGFNLEGILHQKPFQEDSK